MDADVLPAFPPEAGLKYEIDDAVGIIRIDRPEKRNAMNDATLLGIEGFVLNRPKSMKAIVITSTGDHFCAGLDLKEQEARTPEEVMHHSQMWHRVTTNIQLNGVPVVSVLKGAVIGGGFEIAAATHIRVAEEGAFYALPEAARGIYTGGGATVRISRLIGAGRMTELMLTGRAMKTEEGQRLGISRYLTAAGEGEAKAMALAKQVAGNAPLSNFAIINAIPRVENMSSTEGFFTEAVMLGLVHSGEDANRLLNDFLDGTSPRVRVDND